MSEISCRVFEFFDRSADTRGFPVESLLDGTGLTLSTVRDPSRFVAWASWARLCDRFADRLPDEDALIEAGRTSMDMEFWRPAQTLGRALFHPEQLYEALARWLGPALFRSFAFSVERAKPGHIRVIVEQPEGVPPCRSWFLLMQGSLAGVPRVQGAEDALVVLTQDRHRATYDVQLPASRSGSEGMLDELGTLTEEVHKAYQAASASERQLRDLLDALPALVAVRMAGRTVFENPAWGAAFGPTPAQGALPAVLLPHRAELEEPRDGERIIQLHEAGRTRMMSCAPAIGLRWGAGQGTVLMLRDVTAAHDAAGRRDLADRLRSLGTVAAGVGHEINNPLAYALGELEVLESRAIDGNVTSGELRQGLSTVREALLRVRDISRDLLTFGRPPKDWEPTDARAAVDAALRLAGTQLRHSIQLRVALPDTPMVVSGRPGELAQVFLNLAINDRDALADQPATRRRLVVKARTEGGQHVFTFADNGPGVPEAQRARLFEPYFTTKGDGGTGLGLAVCAKITREHGGEIALLDGDGAVFEVRLPVLDAVLPPPPPKPVLPAEQRRLRILVVDDLIRFSTLLPRLLPRHAVVFEQTGEAALSRLAAGERFDVLLCDVMMPGMDGPTLHARLLDVAPDLARRTLFVTGGAFDGGARAYLKQVGQPVLAKPYERRTLVRAIDTLVAAADAEPAR